MPSKDRRRTGRVGRDIPWSKVVAFHREILRRAEDAFFSLPAQDRDSSRWSVLRDFDPEDLAGPWKLPADNLESTRFQLHRQESLYLGGPCYRARRKDRGRWRTFWQPILYREVRCSVTDGDDFHLSPEQGKWNLSPLLMKALDRGEASLPREPDEFVALLLERAGPQDGSDAGTRAEALRRALRAECPEFQDIERSSYGSDSPPDWMLFAPRNRFSNVNRHLAADYEDLEARLKEGPGTLGGLAILDDASPRSDADAVKDVRPIVPLNDSQRRAVEKMLSGQPLTVVSGPPGCGKSRIVVSLLLNAWAEGMSVLFASNNNRAVNVVLERLGRFQTDYPVAVRAGNRKEQRIRETLYRALRSRPIAPRDSFRRTTARIRQLPDARAEHQKALDDGEPQRTDQCARLMLRAIASAHKIADNVNRRRGALASEWQERGLGDDTWDIVFDGASRTRVWLESMESFREKEERDRKVRAEEREKLRTLLRTRDQAAASAGMRPGAGSVWSWAVTDPEARALDEWEPMANALLRPDVLRALRPIRWRQAYDRWACSDDAEEAVDQANEIVRKLPPRLERMRGQIRRIGSHRRKLDETQRACREHGIENGAAFDPLRLEEWQRLYVERVGLPRTPWDWWPWSLRRRNKKALEEAEGELRRLPQLPTRVWARIGVLDNDGRKRLGSLVDDLLAMRSAVGAWDRTRQDRASMESMLQPLRSAAVHLGLASLPPVAELDRWKADRLVQEAAAVQRTARNAGAAWVAKERQRAVVEEIGATTREWQSLRDGTPICGAWARGSGREFGRALDELDTKRNTESLATVRDLLRAGAVDGLRRVWLEVAEHHGRWKKQQDRVRKLPPTGVRRQQWWNQRPRPHTVQVRDDDDWPRLEEPRRELQGIFALCERRRVFEDEVPDQQEKRKTALRKARGHLADVRRAVPKKKTRRLLAELDRALAGDDPARLDDLVEKVRNAVSRFSEKRIRSRIQEIDAELEKHHFQIACEKWRNRLWADEKAYDALQDLYAAMESYRSSLPHDAQGCFREALPLVPNWIVTSQATQALPMEPGLFDLVVVDEASQSTLTDLLPLLYRAKGLVIIGDPEQLPAIHHVGREEEIALAAANGVEDPLLDFVGHARATSYRIAERALAGRRRDVVHLDDHYRSHPQIIAFANQFVYERRLRLRTPQHIKGRRLRDRGVLPMNVRGAAERDTKGRSWWNRDEAGAVVEWIRWARHEDNLRYLTFGVVTPFRAQKEEIEQALRRLPDIDDDLRIRVGTAHAFQGDERDVMVFSPVVARGITPGAVRWVEEPHNLVNVAWTRARRLLVVAADLDFLRSLRPNGILRGIWEYCDGICKLESVEEGQLFNLMLLEGLKPRIQARVGDIQVDFLIPDRRLVVEVDGDQHETSREADRARDAFLRSQGYDVMRIPARDVRNVPHEVIRRIRKRLDD